MSRDLWHIVWAGQPVTCCYEPSRSPTNTFCRDPAPFLANQQHQPPLPWVKGVQKLYKSFNFRIFNDKGQSRQKTLMQNWHDHLVQFKNFMTFCLTSTASCNKVHFCQLHSSPLRHDRLQHPLFKKVTLQSTGVLGVAQDQCKSTMLLAMQYHTIPCNTSQYHNFHVMDTIFPSIVESAVHGLSLYPNKFLLIQKLSKHNTHFFSLRQSVLMQVRTT